MDKTLMLEQLINYFTGGNKSRFAITLSVKPQTINTWLNRKTFDAELIYSKCDGVSGDWLLSGEGEMMKPVTNTATASNGSISMAGNNNKGYIGCDKEALSNERIKHLEELLAEKERLIKVLLERK